MLSKMHRKACIALLAFVAAMAGPPPRAQEEAPLQVCATTPDLGSLVREVGGDAVSVTVLSKPAEDPHFVEAKPSFIRNLHRADLLVLVGMDLEAGYLPVLIQNARNERILRNAPGHVDASTAVQPRDAPAGVVDRSLGDVHVFGNPHYLLDPLNGLRVAALLRDKLAEARQSRRQYFAERYESFRRKMGEALLGKALAGKYQREFETLVRLHEYGKMLDFLKGKGDAAALEGWLGQLAPYHGTKVVEDHKLWTYFNARFGLESIGAMEPKPGIPPTTKHLAGLVEQMKARGARLILAAPYYDPRHAKFLSDRTGAKVARMAHQPGSREGTDDYLSMTDYNVRQIVNVLGSATE